MDEVKLTPEIKSLMSTGLAGAENGLSALVGAPVSLQLDLMTLEPVLNLERLAWAPESEVIGVYISFTGDLGGHCLICLDEAGATALASLLVGEDEEDYELAESALMESGNIMVSWLVNAVADIGGWKIIVSPPALSYDMLGSLVNTILANALSTSEELVAVCVQFRSEETGVAGTLYFMPDADSLRAITKSEGSLADAAV